MIAKHHVGAAARSVCTEERNDIVKGSEKRVEGILKSLAAAKGEGLLRELMGDSVWGGGCAATGRSTRAVDGFSATH